MSRCSCALLLSLLPLLLAAADAEAVLRRFEFTTDSARQAWRTLFSLDGMDADRAVLQLSLQPQAATALAARLVYQGPPLASEDVSAALRDSRWQLRNRQITAAILRAWRRRHDPALLPVYEDFLRQPRSRRQVHSALINAWHCDAEAAARLAARLALPERADSLPSSRTVEVRIAATAVALQHAERQPLLIAALGRYVFAQGEVVERLQLARRLAGAGALPPVVQAALRQELKRQDIERWSDDEREIVAALLSSLGSEIEDQELRQRLVELLGSAPRDVAAAAAGALQRQRPGLRLLPEEVASLQARAQRTPDVIVRNTMLSVLAIGAPAAAQAEAGPGSPWTLLSLHRQALAEWAAQPATALGD